MASLSGGFINTYSFNHRKIILFQPLFYVIIDDSHSFVSCSLQILARVATGISLLKTITFLSNRSVKPLPGLAQGTLTFNSPQPSLQSTRGTRAIIYA